jgi:DNA modification methylase
MGRVIDQVVTDKYSIYNGDCVEVISALPENSIDFCIYSPPFASLYTYSNSDRDMGNVKSDEEFFEHFGFLVEQLYRVMQPGRNMAVHCMNLPSSKARDGVIGIKDFRGDLIKAFQAKGFVYHSEVCIWKDPVVAMQRTKALGLLHKQVKKDSTMSRQGIPDYLVVMRKPGVNDKPVTGEFTHYVGDNPPSGFVGYQYDDGRWYYLPETGGTSIDVWQNYASPVWDDIRQTNTLQYQEGRDSDDERHICPLQLDVIERAMQLWSRPGDVVLTPFLGIGSEAYMAVKMGRRAIGAELKPSYFALAKRHMQSAEKSQYDMFGSAA